MAFESTHPLSWQHWNYLIKILGQLDKHKIPINFYIDLSKAFDCLRHDILLQNLSYYGVTHPARKIITECYLSNRKQFQ